MLSIIHLVIDILLSLPSLFRLLKRVYLFVKKEYETSKFKEMRRLRFHRRGLRRVNSRKTARRLFGKRGGARL